MGTQRKASSFDVQSHIHFMLLHTCAVTQWQMLTGCTPTGSGKSGKSTLVKQMKIIHQDGFSDAELAEYRPVVYKNVLDSAQAVVVYMRKIGLECVEYKNRVLAEKILDYKLDAAPGSSSTNPYFSLSIADAINQLWKDPIIPKVVDEHSSDFYLIDSAG